MIDKKIGYLKTMRQLNSVIPHVKDLEEGLQAGTDIILENIGFEYGRKQIEWGLSVCDILKIADNEGEFMTGESDPRKAAVILHERYPNISMFNITLGPEGSYHECGEGSVFVPAHIGSDTIETTGAGDVFGACVLHAVLEKGSTDMDAEETERMLKFANSAAYLITTKKGALRVMPEAEEIQELSGI